MPKIDYLPENVIPRENLTRLILTGGIPHQLKGIRDTFENVSGIAQAASKSRSLEESIDLNAAGLGGTLALLARVGLLAGEVSGLGYLVYRLGEYFCR